jgi:hypothetical protein
MEAILKFNLDEPFETEEYKLHTQAKDLYFAVGDILKLLRNLEVYGEYTDGVCGDVWDNLTSSELEAQKQEHKALEKKAEKEYTELMAEWEKLGEDEQKSWRHPTRAHVPKTIRFTSEITGEHLVGGATVVAMIRAMVASVLDEYKVSMDILS